MSTPLVATDRVSIKYVVSGITHVWRGYCKRGADVGGKPGITERDTVTNIAWATLAQGAWDTIRELLNTGVPAAQASFEEKSGLVWLPLDFATLTGAGLQSSATTVASQYTAVLRDTEFRKVRWIVLEHTGAYVGHDAVGTLGGQFNVVRDNLNGTNILAGEPFVWQVSRKNLYFLPSGTISGATLSANKKLRRARGLT